MRRLRKEGEEGVYTPECTPEHYTLIRESVAEGKSFHYIACKMNILPAVFSATLRKDKKALQSLQDGFVRFEDYLIDVINENHESDNLLNELKRSRSGYLRSLTSMGKWEETIEQRLIGEIESADFSKSRFSGLKLLAELHLAKELELKVEDVKSLMEQLNLSKPEKPKATRRSAKKTTEKKTKKTTKKAVKSSAGKK